MTPPLPCSLSLSLFRYSPLSLTPHTHRLPSKTKTGIHPVSVQYNNSPDLPPRASPYLLPQIRHDLADFDNVVAYLAPRHRPRGAAALGVEDLPQEQFGGFDRAAIGRGADGRGGEELGVVGVGG